MMSLGVDPGIQHTGYAVLFFQSEQFEILKFGLIDTDKFDIFALRLKKIYDGLCEIIKQYKIDSMSLEEIFYSRNIKVALKMGHARGVALLAAANHQIPVAEYSAREVKMSVTGNGNASKYQVQQMIGRLLQLPTIPAIFDVTDAMAVAYCHSRRAIPIYEKALNT